MSFDQSVLVPDPLLLSPVGFGFGLSIVLVSMAEATERMKLSRRHTSPRIPSTLLSILLVLRKSFLLILFLVFTFCFLISQIELKLEIEYINGVCG